ncbi:MAG: hypothetical protein H0X40_15225 [Chthoniobacterales bacterium]|nr:hypothetical protein [Chthoniobacterales bacterium]
MASHHPEFTPAVPFAAQQEIVLRRRIIPRTDYWRVALSMPPAPDASNYLLEIMCYDPHHRIIITSRDGTAHEVEICFNCQKMRVDSPWVGGIPLVWQHTLLSLFQRYGMPERSSGEYSESQPTAGRRTAKFTMTLPLLAPPCARAPAVADLVLVRRIRRTQR